VKGKNPKAPAVKREADTGGEHRQAHGTPPNGIA
jgi:hypothetical protein